MVNETVVCVVVFWFVSFDTSSSSSGGMPFLEHSYLCSLWHIYDSAIYHSELVDVTGQSIQHFRDASETRLSLPGKI